jgi:hypothetical protein
VTKPAVTVGSRAARATRSPTTENRSAKVASEPWFEGGRARRRAPSSTRNWISIPQPALLPSRKHQEDAKQRYREDPESNQVAHH